MSFKEMIFKGKRVFVEVDEKGALVLDNGRAKMKYRQEDDRLYHPWPANLSSNTDETYSLSPTPANGEKKKTPARSKPTPSRSPIDTQNAIVAYTDGGCIGNPGPAGLGYVITFPDGTRIQKGEPLGQGTNNIAELTAIFRVLEHVTDTETPLIIHTDSTYSIGVLSQGWKAKANQQLIAAIKAAMKPFKSLHFVKVKGHAGVPDNELVDQLANTAAKTQRPQ